MGDGEPFRRPKPVPAHPQAAPAGGLGRHNVFILPPGADVYRRDVADAEVHLLDAGYFALETHHREIAALMLDFLGRKLRA